MKALLTISILFFCTLVQSQTNGQLLKKAYKKNSKESLKKFFLNWNKEIQSITEHELSKLNDTIKQAYSVFTEFYKPRSIDSIGGSEWGNDIYKNVDFLIVQNFIKIYFTDKLFYSDQEINDYAVDCIYRNIEEDSTRQEFLKRTDGKLSERVLEDFGPNSILFVDKKDSLTDSIVNFRPQINCNEKLPLYLTPEYDEILNKFLGNKHLLLGKGGLILIGK